MTLEFTVNYYDKIDVIFSNHPIGDELTLIEGSTEIDDYGLWAKKTIIGAKSLTVHLLNSFIMFMVVLLIALFS